MRTATCAPNEHEHTDQRLSHVTPPGGFAERAEGMSTQGDAPHAHRARRDHNTIVRPCTHLLAIVLLGHPREQTAPHPHNTTVGQTWCTHPHSHVGIRTCACRHAPRHAPTSHPDRHAVVAPSTGLKRRAAPRSLLIPSRCAPPSQHRYRDGSPRCRARSTPIHAQPPHPQ